jgi:two-component system, chemotaxis family, protein-glutamate methylesterase/glutaminase
MNIESLILIGASTGRTRSNLLDTFRVKKNYEGTIVIAQHMSAAFIPSFIHQLQSIVSLPISSVDHPLKLEKGVIYICSLTSQLFIKNRDIWLEPMGEGDYPYNPQVDKLFSSASHLPSALKRLGVILTGIGDDGASGSLALYESGGDCLFESEKSAVVYGMPRRAKELVCNGNVGGIDEIIERIKEYGGLNVRMV